MAALADYLDLTAGDAQAQFRMLLARRPVQLVLANCGSRCVFCGLQPAAFGAKRMLLGRHIKPWKVSTPAERLDPRNGLAACPAHDVAFDTGLLAVNGGLRIHVARSLSDATVAESVNLYEAPVAGIY